MKNKHFVIMDATCVPLCDTSWFWGIAHESKSTPARFFCDVLSKHKNAITFLRCAPNIYCLVGLKGSENLVEDGELKWADYSLSNWQKKYLNDHGSCVLAFLIHSPCQENPDKVAYVEFIESYIPDTQLAAQRLIKKVEKVLGKTLIFHELSKFGLEQTEIWKNVLNVNDDEEFEEYLIALDLNLDDVKNWELLFE